VTTILPFKENSREWIEEIARELQPYLPDITARFRERLTRETGLDPRALATLERVTLAAGTEFFRHSDFDGFLENLHYCGGRLAKLQVDTRIVRHTLALFEELCGPYLSSLFSEREGEALAAMETLSSSSFAEISAAYFDTRTRESQCLLAILDAELTDSDLRSMLQRVLDLTAANFDACAGAILLRDEESDLLRVSALLGLDESLRGEFSVPLGKGFAGQVAHTGEPEMIIDASKDSRIVHDGLKRCAKSLWGMPIRSGGRTIGVMLLAFAKHYEWLPTKRELLRAIADRSALAIQRTKMTDTLREREIRINELSAHLLRAQEEERSRISRELHDETGQGLMTIRLYLSMLSTELSSRKDKQKVQETLDVIDRTVVGLRRIIGHLSPLTLQELGLFAALRKEAKDLELNHGIETRVAISEAVGRLGKDTETAIYRIVQEALHNVAKHAQAGHANVQMTRDDGVIRLLVEDDGVGIFPKGNFRGNSFGLAGIKERVGMLGGQVRVVSLKGKGTRIEAIVPATEPATHTPMRSEPRRAIASREGNVHAEDQVPAR